MAADSQSRDWEATRPSQSCLLKVKNSRQSSIRCCLVRNNSVCSKDGPSKLPACFLLTALSHSSRASPSGTHLRPNVHPLPLQQAVWQAQEPNLITAYTLMSDYIYGLSSVSSLVFLE